MSDDGLRDVLAGLRDDGTDSTAVEAKTARDGFPTDLARTLSAFSNTPGGGLVLLGLDEGRGFEAIGVYDAADAGKRLASVARQRVEPPVSVDVEVREVDGAKVVLARVHEAPAAMKPVRVHGSRKAYLRAFDGDYAMSALEEQALIANREHPRFDRAGVEGTSVDDLDRGLVAAYVATCRASSSVLARFDDGEILLRTGVVLPDRRLTLAGLVALGTYPQQFVPNLVIQASVVPDAGAPGGTRATDARKFDGPLPVMLDEAMRWVQRSTSTRVRFGPDGHGHDEPEYPAAAVRELIANALVHRDLGPHAMSTAITLSVERHQLVVANPGGLWGITVDRLGQERISSARNDSLVRIAQNVRLDSGARVVEALASGIPAILESLSVAGMVPPAFHDQGVRFTVRVPNHALLAADDLEWLGTIEARLNDAQRHALVAMRHGQVWTNRSFRTQFPRDSTVARADLQGLVDAGLAVARGDRGGRTYALAPALEAASGAPSLKFEDVEVPPSRREANAARIVEALRARPMSAVELMAATDLTRPQVDYALGLLRERGDVGLDGRRGVRGSVYRLVR
ncbi:ATP-binding protein [Cellulomonas triticagri]|uniref:ATP-binding protein n=1 Tax=Cellulomonas triticagri TaxID=2483352 RepID=UPI00131582D5|nr:RNA-binding domain-containing protein [Cellulomonas triticagri]